MGGVAGGIRAEKREKRKKCYSNLLIEQEHWGLMIVMVVKGVIKQFYFLLVCSPVGVCGESILLAVMVVATARMIHNENLIHSCSTISNMKAIIVICASSDIRTIRYCR